MLKLSETNPLISVIIPVYNGEMFLQEAIDSLLRQNYLPLEIIVVDDGSTDSTATIAIKNSAVRYFFQENSGPASARNNGLKKASGEFIAFLDCDDFYDNENLFCLSFCLKDNKDVDIAEGKIQLMNYNKTAFKYENTSLPIYSCSLSSCLFRKRVFNKVGFLDERLIYAEDIDWFIRAWENGIFKKRLDVLSLYCRRHQYNMTNNAELRSHFRLLMHRFKLERQKVINNSIRTSTLAEYLGQPNNG